MKWTIRLKFYLEAALRDESCTPREWIHLLVSVGLYCLFLRMLPLGASTFKNWAPVTQTYYLLNKIREAIPSGHLDLAQLWVIVSTFRLRTTPCPLLAKWLLSLSPPFPFSGSIITALKWKECPGMRAPIKRWLIWPQEKARCVAPLGCKESLHCSTEDITETRGQTVWAVKSAALRTSSCQWHLLTLSCACSTQQTKKVNKASARENKFPDSNLPLRSMAVQWAL